MWANLKDDNVIIRIGTWQYLRNLDGTELLELTADFLIFSFCATRKWAATSEAARAWANIKKYMQLCMCYQHGCGEVKWVWLSMLSPTASSSKALSSIVWAISFLAAFSAAEIRWEKNVCSVDNWTVVEEKMRGYQLKYAPLSSCLRFFSGLFQDFACIRKLSKKQQLLILKNYTPMPLAL